MNYEVSKSDEEWRGELSEFEYHVLRQKGTERAGTGEYDQHWRAGRYHCRGCGAFLFESQTKFDAGCGWPSFYQPQQDHAVVLQADNSHGMARVEVLCAACGSHLGHVFEDAPQTPTGDRYCINSVSLRFESPAEPA